MKGSQIPFKKNYILGTSIVLAAFVLGLMLVWTVKTLKSFDDSDLHRRAKADPSLMRHLVEKYFYCG